jgi:glycosyltransferase involved in cell wall biosynthesis
VQLRVFVLRQAAPAFRELGRLDAVMVHLFEADLLLLLRRTLFASPVHVSSTDEAPIVDRRTYPLYPNEARKPVWRQRLRLALDRWRVRRTDHFVPFSKWAGDILVEGCGAPRQRVEPIHVGMDLELWPRVQRPSRPAGWPTRLLFVGTDFVRKGGDLLLDVFAQRFATVAELHLVTRQAPQALPGNVFAYRDFEPNDARLRELYASCDVLVLPTTADVGPLWVFLEAMASALPIVGTDTGSNSELVSQGETGFIVPVGDAAALGDSIARLMADPPLRERMGRRGREIVEERYNAAINVPRILQVMKRAVDERRGASAAAPASRQA